MARIIPAPYEEEEALRRGRQLVVREDFAKVLSGILKQDLARMTAEQQSEFEDEFDRQRMSMALTNLASLLFLHYAYLGRWGLTLLGWGISLFTFGVGMTIWWVVDLFRIPGLVARYNRDVAMKVLRDYKVMNA